MFSASENCARRPPAAFEVEPLASWSRSSRTTSAPASARWNAALTPTTPPPTITTSAPDGSGERRACRECVGAQIVDCQQFPVGFRRMLSSGRKPSRSTRDARPRVRGRAAQPAARAGLELLRRRLRARAGLAGLGAVRGSDRRARRRRRRSRSARAWRRSRPCWRRSRRGAQVVGPAAGYAWTRSLLQRLADAGRIELIGVDTTDTEATLEACEGARAALRRDAEQPARARSPSSTRCARAPCAVAVDGTFASPLLQRALSFGADFAIQSATKFIGGHSDLLLGVVTHDHARRGAAPHPRPARRAPGRARGLPRAARPAHAAGAARGRAAQRADARRAAAASGTSSTTPACRPTPGTSAPRG